MFRKHCRWSPEQAFLDRPTQPWWPRLLPWVLCNYGSGLPHLSISSRCLCLCLSLAHTHTHTNTHTHTSSTYSHGGKKHKPPSAPVCFPQQCEFQQIIQDPLEFKVDCFESNRECNRRVCSHCTPSLGPHGMQGWCPERID